MLDDFRCIESNIFVTAYIRGPVPEVILNLRMFIFASEFYFYVNLVPTQDLRMIGSQTLL